MPAKCAVLTVTDSRTVDEDESGRLAMEILQKFGHEAVAHHIVPNDKGKLKSALKDALKLADLVLTIGGTGPSAKDSTVEVVRGFVDKEMPGFGELFRAESAKEIGTAAILSRALLGITDDGRVLVCTPGSPAAVRLALEGILMNEMKHLLREVRRYR